MKRHFLLTVSLLLISISLLSPIISSARAQDAPNSNITKRRPDRPAGYSPSPTPTSTTKPVEVKQVETSTPSFFAKIWESIKGVFAKIFRLPEASSTTTVS